MSNPATLRELAEQLCDCDGRRLNGRARELANVIRLVLAASGTEAAPVTCESCKSTNTQRYENAGGLKMYSCADCGWHHEVPAQAAASPEAAPTKRIIVTHPSQMSAEALDAGAIGEYVDVPVKLLPLEPGCKTEAEGWGIRSTAASPEGEGREALAKWLHYKLAAAQNLPYEDGDTCFECYEIVDQELLPLSRQSAAPSGGDLREKVRKWREDALNESKSDNEWDATAARGRFYAYDNVWAALAQKSKTGAGAALISKLRDLPVHRIGASNSSWDDVEPTEYVRLSDLNALLAQESKTGAVTERRDGK